MQHYKRNQVEEAIAAVLADDSPVELRIRIKRLLDVDRDLGHEQDAHDPERAYAFYSGAAPGRGVVVWFSPYEAFALLLGVVLLHHRWPQRTAVRILRRARPMLQPAHVRILQRDPERMLDSHELERQAAPGQPAFGSTDPVCLGILSGSRAERLDPEALPHAMRVCWDEAELSRFRREQAGVGTSTTVLELTAPAHALAAALEHTRPKTRGR